MSRKGCAILAVAAILVAAALYYFRHEIDRALGPKPAIVEGELVPRGWLRSAVGLTYGNERQPRCGGVLIAPDMILTAAHCLCGHTPQYAFTGENPFDPANPPRRLYYRLGASLAKSQPCANLADPAMVDVAVIRIQGSVGAFPPLAFADATTIDATRKFRIVGYGATDRAGMTTDFKKRRAMVDAVSHHCPASDQANYGCHAGQEIVAGRSGGADSCRGDSGSPLLVERTVSGRQEHLVAGLVSRGINNRPGCGEGGIYERMTPATRQFIANAVTRLRQSPNIPSAPARRAGSARRS